MLPFRRNVSRACPATPIHSRDDVLLHDSANVACESAGGGEKPSQQLSCVYMQLSCVYMQLSCVYTYLNKSFSNCNKTQNTAL